LTCVQKGPELVGVRVLVAREDVVHHASLTSPTLLSTILLNTKFRPSSAVRSHPRSERILGAEVQQPVLVTGLFTVGTMHPSHVLPPKWMLPPFCDRALDLPAHADTMLFRMDVGCGVRDEAHMGERREIGLLQER
jgi:hypothetical protein